MKTRMIFCSAFLSAALFFSGCRKENMPPVVTLNGDANMTSYKGDTFTDPGATANDNEEGDLTAKIQETGSVGSGVGYYTLDYSVTDKEGSYADVQRNVTVKYKNAYLAGNYNVTETSPFGTTNYTGMVTSGTSDNAEFVFGSTSGPDPIVVDANITGLNDISPLTVAQGGPLTNFTGTITEPSGHVVFTMSYLRPIGNTTTNCTATWTKQ
ncbi:MAG TPA: DUF5011 domain-containing protein [Bacteroidia bacterium]|nr:DUF5011 domain-containing protein [Bacteroidia bacterium]